MLLGTGSDPVVVPTNMRQDKFREVLSAITDVDLVQDKRPLFEAAPGAPTKAEALRQTPRMPMLQDNDPSQAALPRDLMDPFGKGPTSENGTPLSIGALRRAKLVTIGDGRYWMALGDPSSDSDAQWVMDGTGKKFELNLKQLEPLIKSRRPDLYKDYVDPVWGMPTATPAAPAVASGPTLQAQPLTVPAAPGVYGSMQPAPGGAAPAAPPPAAQPLPQKLPQVALPPPAPPTPVQPAPAAQPAAPRPVPPPLPTQPPPAPAAKADDVLQYFPKGTDKATAEKHYKALADDFKADGREEDLAAAIKNGARFDAGGVLRPPPVNGFIAGAVGISGAEGRFVYIKKKPDGTPGSHFVVEHGDVEAFKKKHEAGK
jgi:hypothetical protein